ncbi:xylulokinase [Muricomes intestini]|jgi:xylulokinase|uniref:Xylulose kinase n=3 Tax=Muricomes intestini TaxID=1796634 RepID=A0A4R3KGM0_9FIRM|nr:xylulokinase [Muricomes intestini]TCS82335.1 gluconate kinase (FGGY family) [Muricomes intestini]
MAEYIIAHDLGTSGDKATLFTVDGRVVKSCTFSYDVRFFGKNCAEQNPLDWWSAVCKATKDILEGIDKSNVIALSFSAQMQGCLLVDREGNPLRPSIIWADQRALKEAERLEREIGFDRMYEITGHRLSSSNTLEKIMWLKENEPEVYKRAYKCLQAKDYILYRLTGEFVTDYSDASGTNALDLESLSWSDEILEASGINRELLPPLHYSTDIIGKVTKEAADVTGLCEGTPVVCGGGDGPCAAVGAGCIHDDELFVTFGTSAWVGGTTKKKFLDEEKIFFCFAHVIPGRYMPCGTMQAAGSTYSYIRSLLAPGRPYSELNAMIERSPAGAKGLLFLPYMLGERSPRWNEDTSGAYLGIKMYHTKEDYIRAAIEGVAYNLELILSAYRKYLPVENLILTGGGAKGDVVCQILSDVFRAKLNTPDHVEEATSIAAAMIAGVGVGAYDNFEDITRFLQFKKEYMPDKSNQAVYDKMKRIFDASYYALENIYQMF